jgi:hypothetical protein
VTEKNKARLIFLLKAVVGIGLLAFFVSRLDLTQFARTFSSARLSYVVLALCAYFVGKVLTAVRWALLARPLGFSTALKDFVAYGYIGMFFSLFGLGTLAGDAGRVFYLSREKSGGADRGRGEAAALALVSILADRAVGMAALVWIGAGALIVFPEYDSLVPAVVRYAVFIMSLCPIVAWLAFPFGGRLLRRIDHPLAEKLHALGSAYWNHPAALAQAIVLSLAFHVIQIWGQILIGNALDFNLPPAYAFVVFPLVDIVAMLPVSVSGIGFREGAFVFFLRELGVSAEKAVACGVIWLAIMIVSGLLGGLVFILRGKTGRPL